MAKQRSRPPGGSGSDAGMSGTDPRAAERYRRRSKSLRDHADKQHQARLAHKAGSPNPWGAEGFAGDRMPLWDDDPNEPRLDFDQLHYKHRQAEDGAPALREGFVQWLSATYNTASKEQAARAERAYRQQRQIRERNEQVLDAQAGNAYVTVAQIAGLMSVSSDMVRRAIKAGHLEAQRPGGPYSRYRVSLEAFGAYLVACGYKPEAIAAIGQRFRALLGVAGAARAN